MSSDIRDRLIARAQQLRDQVRLGNEQLAAYARQAEELDERRQQLVTQLLRISGAIQVLDEEIAADTTTDTTTPAPDAVGAA